MTHRTRPLDRITYITLDRAHERTLNRVLPNGTSMIAAVTTGGGEFRTICRFEDAAKAVVGALVGAIVRQ